VSFKLIMTTSVTRSCFTKQHQTCKTKTKTDFLVSDRSCPKTDGLRPHHWIKCLIFTTGVPGIQNPLTVHAYQLQQLLLMCYTYIRQHS